MTQALIDALRAHSDAHDGADGMQRTAMRGLYTVRLSRAGEVRHRSRAPLLCIVGQGAKSMPGSREPRLMETGDAMILAPHEGTAMKVTGASRAQPYLALALRLDAQLMAELSLAMAGTQPEVSNTEHELAHAATRMLQLLHRPAALAVLGPQLQREMHYWLLAGRHGAAMRRALAPKRHAEKIARALALIRSDFRSPLAAERLAAAAGLGMSAFYESFRAATALSPLQYQKRLRLDEARRLLLAARIRVSDAAYAVGYESVPQFVRDYRRAYGETPGRQAAHARAD